MNIKEIQDLIKFVAKSGVTEVEIERKEFKITIKSEDRAAKEAKTMIVQATTPAPVMQVAAHETMVPVVPAVAESEDDKYIKILSPMIGTFYRSAGPDKDSFVSVGDSFKVGDTVCIIEAMKLFNEIEAEITGKIVKVLVDDATPVEYDQPLFLVDPS